MNREVIGVVEGTIKESTPAWSVVLILGAAGCGALGSYLYKTGAQASGTTMGSLVTQPRLAGGVLCYLLVMVLFVAAFKHGGALTVLYPVYASTFIFSALLGLFALGTPILPQNFAGMVLLVSGMYLMGK